MVMNNEWKLTQKQFDWLVDITLSKDTRFAYIIRERAAQLLKTYGHRGWYDVDGKASLNLLTDMVRGFKQKQEREPLKYDDMMLPF